MINQIIYSIPTKILFGSGTLGLLHEQKLPGKKALIVTTNGNSVKRSGTLDKTCKELDLAGVAYEIFDEVVPNPTLKNVMDGSNKAKATNCDFIIGLGGGSAMDCAKTIAFAVTNPGNMWDYGFSVSAGKKPAVADALPIVCITTTAGTGSEVDQWSVITKEETQEKSGFGYASMYPSLSIVDPDLMMSVPPKFTAFQGMDTFFHASESVINTKNHIVGEMFALKAIELVAKYLPKAVNDGNDQEARYNMAVANTLAGFYMLCTSEHTMEHALGGYYQNLPHGAGLIMISHEYFKHFADLGLCDEQFIKMAKAMGNQNANSASDFIVALDKLIADIGMADLKMSDYGIKRDILTKLPQRTREVMGGDLSADPRPLSDDEILGIFERSYR